ncbi:MAG: hypothetical protein ACKOS8_04925 [Gemmataceae bacterium]
MADPIPQADATAPMTRPAEIRPLGLPQGSVRALLSLMVLGMVVIDVLTGQQSSYPSGGNETTDMVEVLWTECLVIVLASYFTTRRFVNLPPDLVKKLEAEGVLTVEKPLGLPRYTMRVVLVIIFMALGFHLWRESRLLEAKSAQILGLALAFLLGALSAPMARWFSGGNNLHTRRWWENFKAVVALASVATCMATSLVFGVEHLPVWATSLTIWVVLFYFGSR